MSKTLKITLGILITIAILLILILVINFGIALFYDDSNDYPFVYSSDKTTLESKLEELFKEEPKTPQEKATVFLKENYQFIIIDILLIVIIIKIDKLKRIN